MVRREHCFGIYIFSDKQTGHIVYIGKDSHIDVKERIKAHYRKSAYNSQPFNKVLQNNPDRYESKVYCHVNTIDELNQLEFDLINLYRPKFNYKHGGEGKYIKSDFEYSVVKGGLRNGKQNYCIQSMFRTTLINSIDYDYLVCICSKLNDGVLTPDEVKRMRKKIIPTHESNIKTSKTTSSTGFYRVQKRTDRTCKKGFIWAYEYYDENGKHKRFLRTDFFELKKEVERRKMIWQITDIDKAVDTIRSIHFGF